MDDRDWLILQTLYHEKNITKAARSLSAILHIQH